MASYVYAQSSSNHIEDMVFLFGQWLQPGVYRWSIGGSLRRGYVGL